MSDKQPSARLLLTNELGKWFDGDLAVDRRIHLADTLLAALANAGFTLMRPINEAEEETVEVCCHARWDSVNEAWFHRPGCKREKGFYQTSRKEEAQ